MLNLIRNENLKLYGRIGTWVMIGLLTLAVIGSGIIVKTTSKTMTAPNWKEDLRKQNEDLQTTISQMENIEATKGEYTKMIKINEYRIEKDIPPARDNSLWGFASGASSLISLISLFTIIIGAGMVASEFSEGTIKLLLIRPSRRWKILLAKYISTLITSLIMLIILFIVSFIAGGILFGFGGVSDPYLSYSNGAVKEVNMVAHIFSVYGYNCVNLLMMATFAFMVSTVFRNSSLAIGISIFLMFTGSTLVQLLSKYNWVKFILFANTNLRMYNDGVPPVKGMTLQFSIAVLLTYFIVFNAISWVGFSKRDVAA
ncbi:ABC transporter permease [Clostridium swellfunianum]|uniref:ABC transporter permease n=1 Tax=Clostridium swellfunianum TaxID=1367462 RepID=UPI002030D5BE|nr:ABC transporter permease [Clostridium swellfunianum]